MPSDEATSTMRAIKFRSWDGEWMCYAPTLFKRVGTSTQDVEQIAMDNYGIEMPLMQFTGLKDVNGKDIYEGDIVKWSSAYNKNSTHVDIVEFKSGFWCLMPWIHELYETDIESLEIYCNIYENPELLELQNK